MIGLHVVVPLPAVSPSVAYTVQRECRAYSSGGNISKVSAETQKHTFTFILGIRYNKLIYNQ
jgi:hypothetical protein